MGPNRMLGGQMLGGLYAVGEILRQSENVAVHRGRHVQGGYDVEVEAVRPFVSDPLRVSDVLAAAARARCRIAHPQILHPIDLGILADGTTFVVSKASDGRSLREHVLLHGPLSAHAAVELARGILSALAAAHEEGVVHGSLDPGSIVLASCEHTTLLSSLRACGSEIADCDYLAPEVAAGDAPTAKSDLFSCAAVLFFACTGFSPKAHGTFALPSAIGRVIVRAMHGGPRMRWDSALEMMRALDRSAADGNGKAQWRSGVQRVDDDRLRANTENTVVHSSPLKDLMLHWTSTNTLDRSLL